MMPMEGWVLNVRRVRQRSGTDSTIGTICGRLMKPEGSVMREVARLDEFPVELAIDWIALGCRAMGLTRWTEVARGVPATAE